MKTPPLFDLRPFNSPTQNDPWIYFTLFLRHLVSKSLYTLFLLYAEEQTRTVSKWSNHQFLYFSKCPGSNIYRTISSTLKVSDWENYINEALKGCWMLSYPLDVLANNCYVMFLLSFISYFYVVPPFLA